MKKSLFFFAAAALALTACSNDDATQQAQATAAPQAVAFDTYSAGTTRSGAAGIMTNTLLQTEGFGVFAFQTEDATYAGTTEKPNFMYNQQVTYTAPSWGYEPLKFWPNETTQDSQGAAMPSADPDGAATSTTVDRLSFFAYAPYINVTSSTGAIKSPTTATDDTDNSTPTAQTVTNVGITKLSKNDDAGNPLVSYQMAYTPSKSVDLVWGVAPAGGLSYETVNPEYTPAAGSDPASPTLTVNEGMPLINLIKPAKDQKIKFLFRHALARLGMTVVAAVDQIGPGGKLNASQTRIYVNSITITDGSAPATIPTSGDLNLKNTSAGVAKWENTAISNFKLVVNSSRELNPKLQGSAAAQTQPGVTTSETDVIKDASGNTKYFMLIPTPGTAAKLDVTIDYTVVTNDSELKDGWAVTNNVITKKITLNSTETGHTGFTNNKAYNLRLILGLTSVKFDAQVSDWEIEANTDVNLPRNNE